MVNFAWCNLIQTKTNVLPTSDFKNKLIKKWAYEAGSWYHIPLTTTSLPTYCLSCLSTDCLLLLLLLWEGPCLPPPKPAGCPECCSLSCCCWWDISSCCCCWCRRDASCCCICWLSACCCLSNCSYCSCIDEPRPEDELVWADEGALTNLASEECFIKICNTQFSKLSLQSGKSILQVPDTGKSHYTIGKYWNMFGVPVLYNSAY